MDLAEMSRRGNLEALGNIAERQEGYFSAAQAAAAGIERHRLQRLARQGVIERDERGIYRFVVYPHGERAELWRAVLWPSIQRGNLTGILSHGTALSLHEVSTVNPATVDLSISRSLRLRRGIPPAYRIHRRDLDPGEVTRLHGLPLTTLFRTLFDLIVSGEDRQFVAEALDEAPCRGLLTMEETKHLRALSAVDPSLLQKAAQA
jgi:predicted transcriptional regulator of viral defense system